MRTLHSYVARELLKTFLMTATALTVLLVMGGGVANLIRGEGLAANKLLLFFMFSTPLSISLILPVAALFSTAITYGRMASDNEILACQAAGINVHRLLLPAFLLGTAVTIFTFMSWNFILPNLFGKIAEVTRKDLPSIVEEQFKKAKPVSYGKYNMFANRCERPSPDKLRLKLQQTGISLDKLDKHEFLLLTGVSFIEMDDQDPAKYGTADETIIDFDLSDATSRITADLQTVRSFDATHRQYYELKHQLLGPFPFPFAIKQKTKFETLDKLIEYRRHPEKIPEIDDLMWKMKRKLMECFLAMDVNDAFSASRSYTLLGTDLSYKVEADQYRIDPFDGRPCLQQNVRITETRNSETWIYTADSATIEVKDSFDRKNPSIEISMIGNVESARVPSRPDDHLVKKAKDTLQSVPFLAQPGLSKQIADFDFLTMLDKDAVLPIYQEHEKTRIRLLDRFSKYKSEITGEIHFRASYSLGTIAVVLLGAILGIIVRGGQVLTAFGISCIPLVFVIVGSVMGKNLSDRPQYELLSIIIMWSTAAIMYAATVFIATKVLKR